MSFCNLCKKTRVTHSDVPTNEMSSDSDQENELEQLLSGQEDDIELEELAKSLLRRAA
jgi:hypothetical protein